MRRRRNARVPVDLGPPGEPASVNPLVVVRNALSSYGLRFIWALSTLLLTPYLFRTLGVAAFGTWSVVFTFESVFSLLELGFLSGVTKLIAGLIAERRRGDLRQTFWAAVILLFAVGAIAAIVSATVGFVASGLAAPGERHAFTLSLLVLGIERLLYFPLGACAGLLAGSQRYHLVNAARSFSALSFAIGTVIAVQLGGNVLAVVITFCCAHFAGGLLYAVFAFRTERDVFSNPGAGTRESRRLLAGFGSYVLLSDSMVFIGQRMDTIVIAAVRNASAAAPYAAALKLQTGVQSLTLPFAYVLMPIVSDLWARGRVDDVRRRLVLSTRVALQMTLPVALALALFAGDAVTLWLGPSAPPVTSRIVILLMAAAVATLAAAPAEQFLIGVGRPRVVALLGLIEGFSNLGLSVALVWRYGAIGAAIGTLATSGVLAWLKFPFACRAVEIPVLRFASESLLPAFASSLPGLALMVAIRLALPPGHVRFLLGAGSGLGLAASIAFWQLRSGGQLGVLRAMLQGSRAEVLP